MHVEAQAGEDPLASAYSVAAAGASRLAMPTEVPSLTGAWGASVTLRYDGRVIGRGQVFGDDPDASNELRSALNEAVDEAAEALGARYPLPRDQLAIAFGPAIAVDVELAGEPVPMAIASFAEASLVVSPGLEGLLVEAGGTSLAMFPGAIRTARGEPASALPGLIERAVDRPGLARRPMAQLREEIAGLRLSRFRARQMAQPAAGRPPMELHRGGQALAHPVPVDELRIRASRVEGFLGRVPRWIASYEPISGDATPAGGDGSALLDVLRWLSRDRVDPLPEASVDRTIDLYRDRARGLTLYLRTLRGDDRETLVQELAALTREQGVASLASEMPWLGFAAIELGDEAPVAAPVLREFLELARSHQLSPEDVGPGNEDLIGGIVFTSRANPLPDWRSAQVLAFSAAALDHPALVPEADREAHLAHVRSGARFVAQLVAGEAEGHTFADPQRAMGGVRGALWDPDMRVDAAAISRLALELAADALERSEPVK